MWWISCLIVRAAPQGCCSYRREVLFGAAECSITQMGGFVGDPSHALL
jgi:hypothetical protein